MTRDAYDHLRNLMQNSAASSSREAQITRLIYRAEVIDVADPLEQNRIRVFIPDIDKPLEQDKDKLAWCQYFFASNIQHTPKVGEQVAVILENPWKKDHGRWWLGPVFSGRTVAIPLDAIGLAGRPGNSLELMDNGNIEISTDTNKPNFEVEAALLFDKAEEELRAIAKDIVLDSRIQTRTGRGETAEAGNEGAGDEYSLPYGERLVELLRFILQTLKTHSHPPNAPPKPTFFKEATEYQVRMEDWLLNKNVRHRGDLDRSRGE